MSHCNSAASHFCYHHNAPATAAVRPRILSLAVMTSYAAATAAAHDAADAGQGLFTTRMFHKNELITEYYGPVIGRHRGWLI